MINYNYVMIHLQSSPKRLPWSGGGCVTAAVVELADSSHDRFAAVSFETFHPSFLCMTFIVGMGTEWNI
jgi:hypothetical protein